MACAVPWCIVYFVTNPTINLLVITRKLTVTLLFLLITSSRVNLAEFDAINGKMTRFISTGRERHEGSTWRKPFEQLGKTHGQNRLFYCCSSLQIQRLASSLLRNEGLSPFIST